MASPDNFLGLPPAASDPATAGVVILPIPYEASVSYGRGTAQGPRAILTASQQVELYDREWDSEPALAWGIHTRPALSLPAEPADVMQTIAAAVAPLAAAGRLVVGLGGEHSLSLGLGRGLLAGAGGPLTIVQIDAHSDLRDRYDDSPYSHACVARRLLEEPGVEQILQLGIRSICPEEVAYARAHPDRVQVWYREAVADGTWRAPFSERVHGRRVYLTLDVDGLDPGLIPATGTPEPDGLTWGETLDILRTTTRAAAGIVGLDCVELAPIPGHHAADFTTAKLIYKAISYARGIPARAPFYRPE